MTVWLVLWMSLEVTSRALAHSRLPQLSARVGGRSGRCLSIWLVDVAALGARAFAHRSRQPGPGLAGAPFSLRGLLEDEVGAGSLRGGTRA